MGSGASKSEHRSPGGGKREYEQVKTAQPFDFKETDSWVKLNSSYMALYKSIISLVEKNKYSDLLVICGDDRYPVHRAIVCPRSRWFEIKCELATRNPDSSSPACPMRIWLDPGEESYIIAAVLTFIYTLDYKDSGPQLAFGLPQDRSGFSDLDSDGETETGATEPRSGRGGSPVMEPNVEIDDAASGTHEGLPLLTPSSTMNEGSPSPSHDGNPNADTRSNQLVFHTQMFAAGQRFGVPPLSEVARLKLERRLRTDAWQKELVGCIREVYQHPNVEELKDVVMKVAKRRIRELRAMEDWEALIMDLPAVALELMKHM